MPKRPKSPLRYFYPLLTEFSPDGREVVYAIVPDLHQATSESPSSPDHRLIARMRMQPDGGFVVLPGVWGYCGCHGWQFDPVSIPDHLGFMPDFGPMH